MPHDPSMRPAWMIRIGLFLYDHLARREVLPGSRTRRPAPPPGRRAAEAARSRKGFVYSDGWVDDARLVVLNAHRRRRARRHGADAHALRRRAARRRRTGRCTLESADGGAHAACARARWSTPPGRGRRSSWRSTAHLPPTRRRCAWSRAATSSCRKLFEHDHAYIFQNPDKRIIFAIPYEGDFTLIGTTDVEHHGAIGAARIDAARDRLPVRAGEPLFRASR